MIDMDQAVAVSLTSMDIKPHTLMTEYKSRWLFKLMDTTKSEDQDENPEAIFLVVCDPSMSKL